MAGAAPLGVGVTAGGVAAPGTGGVGERGAVVSFGADDSVPEPCCAADVFASVLVCRLVDGDKMEHAVSNDIAAINEYRVPLVNALLALPSEPTARAIARRIFGLA